MEELRPFLVKQIDTFQRALVKKARKHNFDLHHPEVVALSQSLDKLIVRYWDLFNVKYRKLGSF